MLIYKVVNKINGKVYIGQTVRSFEERKSEHLRDVKISKNDSYFHNAIRKYGPENFVWEVFEECNTIEELNEKEEYWIKELNTIAPGGYNLQSGGLNKSCHEESKRKISKSLQGENHPRYGKKYPEMSKRMSGENNPMYGKKRPEQSERMLGENNPNYGKSPSEETLKKRRKALRGENNPRAKLTEADVIDIRRMAKNGMKQRDIAKIKNITRETVSHIVTYKLWKHIP